MGADRIHAILIEPQLERFRELCGLGDAPLSVTFEGWHRHAILSSDRVFLFPRDRLRVPGLLREAAVLEALQGRGVPAPRLLGRWRDEGVSPYPFSAVSRLPGRTWSGLEADATLDQLTAMLSGLGQAVASWHRLDIRIFPRRLRARRPEHLREIERWFDTDALERAATYAVDRLGLPPGRADAWLREVQPLAAMAPVFVHGDINEGQILVDDELRITGILDWETAGVGHPLKDFDLGEWGYGIFEWESDFDVLRRRMWEAYARARGGELPSWRAVHRFFCLTDLKGFDSADDLNAWGRTRLANILDLLARLEDASPA